MLTERNKDGSWNVWMSREEYRALPRAAESFEREVAIRLMGDCSLRVREVLDVEQRHISRMSDGRHYELEVVGGKDTTGEYDGSNATTPNGSEPGEVSPPELDGSADLTDGSELTFNESGFADFESGNALEGSVGGGFGPTGSGGSGGSTVLGVGIVAAGAYAAYRATGGSRTLTQTAQNVVRRVR